MLEQLHSLDTNALIALNSLFPAATDTFWLAATKTITWLPLYAVLLHRLYISSTAVLFVKRLALVVIGVLLFDQGAALFKYTLERPRPCHDLEGLRVLAHCSPFGFFSAHAANSFGLAFLFRKWVHSSWFPILIGVALVQSFSRIHLGVHYPLDLFAGAVWGFLISVALHKIEKTWS